MAQNKHSHNIQSGLLTAALICFASFFATPTLSIAQNIKIGISLPLSGNAAPLGRQFIAGARLALQTVPAANNLSLVISDDGCDKELAKLAIDDIKAAGVVMVTGFLCNEPAYIAANALSDKNIPLLISAARSNRILKDKKRYQWNIWQMAPNDADIAHAAFEKLSRRWRSTPYAIVDDGTIFGRTQADEFRALMEEAGNKPQFVDNFRPAQSTQAGLIRRLGRSGVEAMFLATTAQDAALIARNMIEFGTGTIEIATGEAVGLLPYIEDNKDVPIGLLAIMREPPETLPGVKALLEVIEKAKLEPEPYLLLGYATMQVVAEFIHSGKADLSQNQYTTILGNVVFDAEGKNTQNPYQLFRWNGTKFIREGS